MQVTLFKNGVTVWLGEQSYIVDHVIVSSDKLMIQLYNRKDPVNANLLYCIPTEIDISNLKVV